LNWQDKVLLDRQSIQKFPNRGLQNPGNLVTVDGLRVAVRAKLSVLVLFCFTKILVKIELE